MNNLFSRSALIDSDPIYLLDQQTVEQFAQTVNKLKGTVTILFITHQLPKGLQVDEVVVFGKEHNEQQPAGLQTSGFNPTEEASHD